MPFHEITILLSLSLTGGCAAGDGASIRKGSTAPPATQKVADPTTSPTSAPSARVVQPVDVRKEGRNRIRTFELRPGDSFESERGGVIKLSAIRDDQIVLKRTYGWTIPARPMQHAIGNWEYIKVVSVDREAPSLRLELRTITKKYPWEALSNAG